MNNLGGIVFNIGST